MRSLCALLSTVARNDAVSARSSLCPLSARRTYSIHLKPLRFPYPQSRFTSTSSASFNDLPSTSDSPSAGYPPLSSGCSQKHGLPPTEDPSIIKDTSVTHGRPPIELRPYQEDSIEAVLASLAQGERRLGLSLATGSGKTVIFSHLIDRIPPPNPDATQTLILAHRRELVDQAAKHCRQLYPHKRIEVEMAAQNASGLADITVASVQSITSGDPPRLTKYDPAKFKLVLVDEAHHIAARTYLDVLKHFDLLDKDTKGHTALIGVSATFERQDGLSLGKAIDEIVYHKDYVDMIDDRWLADLIFTTVRSGADLSKVKTSNGEFQTGSLSKAVNTDEQNEITVRAWLAKAKERKSTLGFCVDKAHVRDLTDKFRQHGIDAHYVTSDTKAQVRRERLQEFKAGNFPVFLNCGIFTEGTDIPNIDCVLLARPTKSRGMLVQMIGRGLRLHAGKQNCHVIDMVASLKTGIVTTPTLFGLDPDEEVEEADATTLQTLESSRQEQRLDQEKLQEEERQKQSVSQWEVTSPDMKRSILAGDIHFTDYESINDLIGDTSRERFIRSLSPYAWVQTGEHRYRLPGCEGSYISILREEGTWSVMFYPKLPKTGKSSSPWGRALRKADNLSFEAAVRAAGTLTRQDYYKDKFPQYFIAKNAGWRKLSATKVQVDLLNKLRGEGEKLTVDDITKGDAADQLTKLKSGAQSQFKGYVAAKKKAEKVSEEKRSSPTWPGER